ncbi:hypothetical protein DFJ68_0734 [Terracoccus luteus]|uniref:Uncharacterized protein n=1 Tax=Terracoccus luteus TaxID=53356 RepID=A0A495XWV3_9MICO|nr:hypothetical protein DFJ68_0734 [Terracoccus luteus]
MGAYPAESQSELAVTDERAGRQASDSDGAPLQPKDERAGGAAGERFRRGAPPPFSRLHENGAPRLLLSEPVVPSIRTGGEPVVPSVRARSD